MSQVQKFPLKTNHGGVTNLSKLLTLKSRIAIPMATKLGRVVTQHGELPLIKLLGLSITWFCGVTWRIKYLMCLLVLDQWPPRKAGLWLIVRSFLPKNSHKFFDMCTPGVTWQIKKIFPPSQCLWPTKIFFWGGRGRGGRRTWAKN